MLPERQKFIDNMAEHINDDVDPKVGIFWYDITNNKLFGVIKYNYDDEELKPSKGLITCSELHKYIWKRKYHHQKFKNNGIGPYIGDYKDTPRGRIFYDVETGDFIICVGSWINNYPEVKKQIIKEFNLKHEFYQFKIDRHWEIGCGWENE